MKEIRQYEAMIARNRMTQHGEALRKIIELDHHQPGPESRATEIARAAMQKAAETEPGLDAFTIERCAQVAHKYRGIGGEKEDAIVDAIAAAIRASAEVGEQQQQQRLKDEELVLLRQAYDSGVADEREHCAQVADSFCQSFTSKGPIGEAAEIATAIRALKD